MAKFNEVAAEKLEALIEDEALRATVLNVMDQAHTDDVAGLTENRDDILKEKKEIVTKFETLEASFTALGDSSKLEIEKLQKSNAELTANPGDENVKITQAENKAKEQLRLKDLEYKAALELVQKDLIESEQKNQALDQEIVDGMRIAGLSASLDKANVKIEDKPMLMEALLNKVYVDTIGNERKVKFKHGELNTPYAIEDGIKTWAGDLGKRYVAANINRGAGASGSNGNGSGANKNWKTMTIEEKNHMMRQDPELARQLKANA